MHHVGHLYYCFSVPVKFYEGHAQEKSCNHAPVEDSQTRVVMPEMFS